jgi:uncharacterized LabA/DUF88 family protein
MKKERCYVYIDGGNLYRNLKQCNAAGMEFNFKSFVESIVGNRRLEGVRYYIGQVKPEEGNARSLELHKNQQRLFEKLKKHEFYIVRGRLRRIGDVYTEKGVDVRIGIDIVEGAYENRYDTAILISSDGDFAPALEMTRRKGKKVEVVGFSHKPSFSLVQNSDFYHNLSKESLVAFIPLVDKN